mgnify:CR=1 FL=1|jgi:N,N'-diacetyllegionaminate synthase
MPLTKTKTLMVRGRPAIGVGISPYIISEIGTNHNQSLETARELVRQTAIAGCDCAKFQIYEPNEIVSENVHSSVYGLDEKYGDVSARDIFEYHLKTPKEWFPELLDFCHELGLDCCITIHGEHGLQWARNLSVDLIKLASMDHTNIPFMESLVDSIDVPIIASFGMAVLDDIDEAVAILRNHSAGFALFHCVAIYPPKIDEMHIRNIAFLRERYGLQVGFSDHTSDTVTCIAAVAQGATVFEKHLTLDCAQDGPDHKFALEPKEMTTFVGNIQNTYKALGQDGFNEPSKQELINRKLYLKSIILKRDLPAGHRITRKDIYLARPGTGLQPKYLNEVLSGKLLVRDVYAEQPLLKEDLALTE